ncbi:MAG: hypothetical protein DRK00_04170 [Thermoprotei archaeon]|nr:MAG: hypothetical protein DRK00_04170 [Thermoprotei archaeon]
MENVVELPPFKPTIEATIEDAVRDPAFSYEVEAGRVELEALAKVAFAAQGCTDRRWGGCLRAAPSAGATYPLQLYVVALEVEGLEAGVYRYRSHSPRLHSLEPVALGRRWEGACSFVLLFEERAERTTSVYGERGYMYVREEVGHAAQGAVLEASVLGLAARVRRLERPLMGLRAIYCVEVGVRGRRASSRELSGGLLPPPLKPAMSLEEAILARRSIRRYKPIPLSLAEISTVLAWSAAGAVRPYPQLPGGYRVECCVVAKEVEGLKAGVYRYEAQSHSLSLTLEGDLSRRLARACLGQEWVEDAAANLVMYAPGANASAEVEAGMMGQCAYLAATSLKLGTVAVGAFYDDEVASLLRLGGRPLYVFPIGKP